jgi:hypothetical protein
MSSAYPTISEDGSLRLLPAAEVIEAARLGQTLRHAVIADLRPVLEGLEKAGETAVLRCADCQIVSADCAGLNVTVGVELQSTVFVQPASFAYSTFGKPVSIAGARFVGDAIFVSAQFAELARFTGTSFERHASFQSAQFARGADFEWTRFAEGAAFDFAQFQGAANFHETRLGGTVTFCMVGFEGTVNLRGAQCSDMVNLVGAVFAEGAAVNLCDVHLKPGAHVLLTIQQLGTRQRPLLRHLARRYRGPGRRWVTRWATRLDEALARRWPSVRLIDGEDSKDPARLLGAAEQYNLLRDSFRALPGREMEEDRCHYKYKDLLRRGRRRHGLRRLLDWGIYKWCLGYGIHTRRILLTGIGTVLLFAGIYWLAAGPGTIRSFDARFNSLYFSVVTFTTIGYGDYAPLGWLRVPAGFEGLSGLVLTAVFTVSFARKLIR